MNNEMYEIVKSRKGFIAALDQSGGSSGKTLEKYGIPDSEYQTDEEMFNLIHEMRKRVLTSKVFNKDRIIGAILFEKTMLSKINDKFTADYLWEDKKIVSFLKIDKGLLGEFNGVKLMNEIPNLVETLKLAKEKNIFGTKMRSVIYEANPLGIKQVIDQQFQLAKIICENNLVPIIEPEVDINCKDKELCEQIMKGEIIKHLNEWDEKNIIMFKFTLPTVPNYYYDLYNYKFVLKIVALSGGYTNELACALLALNNKMIASFSRALLENLRVTQTEEEFDNCLNKEIQKIYEASIT